MTALEALYKIRVMLGVEDTNSEVSLETETETSEIKLAEATLVDGTVVYTDGELEVGKRLLIRTEEGVESPYAPSGIHETTDGLLIGVGDEGEIMEISEVDESEVEEEVVVEEKEQFGDDFIKQIVGALSPKFDDLQTQINSMKGEFSEFKDGPATDKIKNNIGALNKAQTNVHDARMATILELRKQSVINRK
jgi:hypothetical protein